MKKVLSIIITLLFITNINILSQNRGGMFHKFGSSVLTANHITESQYCPEFQAVYNAFNTKPHADTAAFMNAMVYSLDSAGFWDRMDLLQVYAIHNYTDALINWINPGTLTATLMEGLGSDDFTRWRGFTGDGTGYISTNYAPGTHGVNFTQNDATYGVYVRNTVIESRAVLGIYGSNVYSSLQVGSTENSFTGKINHAYNDGVFVYNITDAAGFYLVTRTSSTYSAVYKNGSLFGTSNDASVAIESDPVLLMLTMGPYNYGITSTEAGIINTIIQRYITSISN